MSAAAVVRSACHALRRPLFPRALMVMERQPPPPRFSPQAAENFSVRRFHSSDCTAVGKPATATVEDSTSLKLDRISRSLDRSFDEVIVALKEIEELEQERRRGRRVLAGTIVAGVLAAIYVKRRFFGGANKEEDKEI